MPDTVSIVVPTYRDSVRTINLIRQLRHQVLPDDIRCQLVVVDDGSEDGSWHQISKALGDFGILHRLPRNRGRAIARNEGASRASGRFLLFMDSDCLPADSQFIASHVRSMSSGTAATIGPVFGDGTGFWNHYQTAASRRRAKQHANGVRFSGSSQNLMVRRKSFIECGGFDPRFRTYGFEDRDLQIRLSSIGEVRWVDDAAVRHMDHLSLRGVSRKMREAGGQAATLFARAHPQAYVDLGYAALDARKHPSILPLASFARFAVPGLARMFDSVIAEAPLPISLKSAFAKTVAALAYMSGTINVDEGSGSRK